ncbi:hypothetical protein PG991_011710 [Apiospora marii]|uniref:Uncharacterized protein n=1 Tax=Apiospora marii TaxID=335849 RepID=A0ABR1REY4_9PEZI
MPLRSSLTSFHTLGWMTFAGWQAVTASAAYLIGTLLQSIIAILSFAVFINIVASKTLAHFEGLILVLQILGFFAIMIPLVYLGPQGDVSLFTTFVKEGGWVTKACRLWLICIPERSTETQLTFLKMVEEIRSASTVVPRAIVISIGLNGI